MPLLSSCSDSYSLSESHIYCHRWLQLSFVEIVNEGVNCSFRLSGFGYLLLSTTSLLYRPPNFILFINVVSLFKKENKKGLVGLPCCLCIRLSLYPHSPNFLGLWDHQALCLFVYEAPPNFWKPEPIFVKLGIYIMAPEPISTTYFINSSHQSLCLYVYPLIVARQWLGKSLSRQRIHR
jgi:hypothetical protein